ncbi:MAG: hypothetical protein JOZ73_00540 [Solirubrobacterales bacterium]|nr:hypothetical protein [Solirubrobacterales bacterium]
MSKASPICVALISIVMLSSCGSSEPSLSTYKKDFQQQKAQFTQLGNDLQAELQAFRNKTNAQLAGDFASLSTRANQTAAQLRQLKPPSKYKNQNSQLATQFNTVAADLSSISTAATQNNVASARTGLQKLVQDAGSLRSVDQSLSGSLGLPQTQQ